MFLGNIAVTSRSNYFRSYIYFQSFIGIDLSQWFGTYATQLTKKKNQQPNQQTNKQKKTPHKNNNKNHVRLTLDSPIVSLGNTK